MSAQNTDVPDEVPMPDGPDAPPAESVGRAGLNAETRSLHDPPASDAGAGPAPDAISSLSATHEPRFRRMFESNIIGIFLGELGGSITDANGAFLRIVGYTREDIKNRRLCWDDLIPRDDESVASRIAQGIARLQSERVIVPRETVLLCRDGSRATVLMGGALFEGSDSYGFSFVLDLTEHRQTLRALEESEQRFKSLFEYHPDGILAVDREGRFTLANPACTRISGYSREELLSMSFLPMVAPDVVERTIETFSRTLQGEATSSETAVITKSGERVELGTTGVPIYVDGEIVGSFGIAQDITERKRAEAALRASEERYRVFVSQSSEAIWRVECAQPVPVTLSEDEQLVAFFRGAFLAECNDSMARMYGYDAAEEIIGARLEELLPRTAENDAYLKAWIGSGYRLVDAESQEFDREGNTKYFSNTFTGIIEDGCLLRAWGTQRDITARRQVEIAQGILAEAGEIFTSSLEYEKTLQNVADLVVKHLADVCTVDIVEGNGTISRLAVKMANPTDNALLSGIHQQSLFHPEAEIGPHHAIKTGQISFVPHFEEVALKSLARDSEALNSIARHGCQSYVSIPLIAGGRTLGAVSFISVKVGRFYRQSDLSLMRDLVGRAALAVDNARLYREAQQAREDAEKANRSKDEFLAVVSHELRTPLTPMLGWLDLMKAGRLEGERLQTAIDAIERNAQVQNQLINDLLDVSRIITGNLRLNMEPVHLATLVKEAAETTQLLAEEHKITFTSDIHGVGAVIGDALRMQQIIGNLLANAIKFTPEGGVIKLALDVKAGKADNPERNACITVSDTGIGIEPEFLPFVFDRFRQADTSTTRRQGGLGLGLSIVRHLVEMHGGTVVAQSAGKNQGTTFTVCLPLASQDIAAQEEALAAK